MISKLKLKLNQISLCNQSNNLARNYIITDVGIQSLVSNQVDLKILSLSNILIEIVNCNKITDKSLQLISQVKGL